MRIHFRLMDPECPTEQWWSMAAKYPLEAEASVLFPLLTLESPERWKKLEAANIGKWISRTMRRIGKRRRCLFACDCAERALLAVKTSVIPSMVHLDVAIETARRFANHQATGHELDFAIAVAEEKYAKATSYAVMHTNNFYYAAAQAVQAARHSIVSIRPGNSEEEDASWACDSAVMAIRNADGDSLKEQQWQWQRLQQYLRGETK